MANCCFRADLRSFTVRICPNAKRDSGPTSSRRRFQPGTLQSRKPGLANFRIEKTVAVRRQQTGELHTALSCHQNIRRVVKVLSFQGPQRRDIGLSECGHSRAHLVFGDYQRLHFVVVPLFHRLSQGDEM